MSSVRSSVGAEIIRARRYPASVFSRSNRLPSRNAPINVDDAALRCGQALELMPLGKLCGSKRRRGGVQQSMITFRNASRAVYTTGKSI